jgi:hypothetical protein
VYKGVKNLMTESKMSMIRQDAHNKAVDYNSSQNLYMTFFEAICFMGICAFNLYHIKSILENRRIIWQISRKKKGLGNLKINYHIKL